MELRIPETKEVRFKLSGDVIYKKQEVIEVSFLLDNKVIKNFLLSTHLLREKNPNNVIPTYLLTSEYNSELREDARSFKLKIEPNGKDIKSVLSLEFKNKQTNQIPSKLVDMQATFTHNADSQESDVDYKVDVKYSSARKTSGSLTGDVAVTMFKSKIDLNLEFNSKYYTLPSPANLKIGHAYDGSKGAKSYVEVALKVPSTPVNHGLKTLIGFGEGFSLEHLEFQVSTPTTAPGKPMIVSTGKTSTSDGVTEVRILIDNFNIDLSTRTSAVAKALIKVDENSKLNRFLVIIRREKSQDGKVNAIGLQLEKNGKDMAMLSLKTDVKLDLAKIVTNAKEIPRQEAQVALNVKILEFAGSMEASVNLEKSAEKNLHVAQFEFKTDSIIKFLTKISNVNLKVEKRGDSFKSNFELIRLGDLRSLKIASTSGIRKNGDWNEVDVSYEKSMANGDKKAATGVVKYTHKDYFNSQIKLDIAKVYRLNFQIQNENGNRLFHFNRAHLDFLPVEGDYKIQVERKTDGDLNLFNLNVDAKRGEPNALSNPDKLELYVTGNLKSVKLSETTLSRDADLKLKLKTFRVDFSGKSSRNTDLKTKTTTVKADVDAKFPSFRNPGTMAVVKGTLDGTQNAIKDFKLKSQLDVSEKSLTLDVSHQVLDGFVNVNLNAVVNKANNLNAKLVADVATRGLKSLKFSVQQDFVKTYASRLLKQDIGVADCSIESSFERVKDKPTGKYLLDSALSAKCDGQTLGD